LMAVQAIWDSSWRLHFADTLKLTL
jgi:hypothetical protein